MIFLQRIQTKKKIGGGGGDGGGGGRRGRARVSEFSFYKASK